MLLSYRNNNFEVPHTSPCIVQYYSDIHDGDIVDVVSPVFSSTKFSSQAINMSDSFKVKARVNDVVKVESSNVNGSTCSGILVCDDNDVFNMYVRIQ